VSNRHTDWPARLQLDPSVFVAPGATVVGEVTIGARSSVWFGTVLRGDGASITIGAETNLQDLTLVHVDEDAPTVVGDRVTVGHRAIVHGCTIADDCLIGMGAIVLSHARIGAGSLIGAGALVKEGQVIPPGSLALGAPARVIGPVSEAHRAAIAEGTRHYVELARAYLAKGFGRGFPPPRAPLGIHAAVRPPMSWAEWWQGLATLAEGPAWASARLAEAPGRETVRPGEGRWSARDVLGHLRDADRDVFLPRLDHMLRERMPEVDDVDLTLESRVRSYDGHSGEALLTEWRALRGRLVARLAPLGREDWARLATHSKRGTMSLAETVRGMVEHDLSHRRQLAIALGLLP
jgi:carbonic anhydrase/acetyltransferase-like protein (isoleucine patch superfamily)